MTIIVGLGNYGQKYENTFHNIGFMVVDELSKKLSMTFSKEKFKSLIAEKTIGGEKVMLVKPLTYMNNSGEALVLLKKKYKDARIIVVVDDIELKRGNIRYREHGSGGTHNGLKSIVSYIGEDFERVRVGIGRDETMDLVDYVLSKLSIADHEEIDKGIEDATRLIMEKIGC